MDALTRTKEYLANQAADGTQRTMHADHPEVILAALVAEIEGAPVGTVDRMGDDEDGNPRLVIGMTRIEIRDMPNVMFKRVRLLALDSGDAGEVANNFNRNEEKGDG